jgi:arylsulfatase A-like enzyme
MLANDLRLRESQTTLAEILREAGYRTGFVGKWHLDGGQRMPGWVPPGARRQGFEFWAANEVNHNHFDSQYFRDSEQPIPIRTFEPEVWTDLGIEFLREGQKDGRPFFLTIQMGPPHDPYRAPEHYLAMYDPVKLTLRSNFQGDQTSEVAEPNPYVRTPGRREIAAYYAMITGVDEQVGRIAKVLEELGMADDTIVLFSSDHGDMLGSHGLRLKRKPWEESIRVPGIFRYPRRVSAGQVTDALLSHVDFAPTLLALCGLKRPPEMQGTDLSPVLLDKTDEGPESVFFQIFGPFEAGGVKAGWRGVRTGRYMYARYQSQPWLLYDLQADPYELKNLVKDSASVSVRKEMEKKLAAWMKETGDSWRNNWTFPVEDKGRLYSHQTFYTVEEYLAWAKQHPELAPQ